MIDCKSSMTSRATHRHAIESAAVDAHLQLVAWTRLPPLLRVRQPRRPHPVRRPHSGTDRPPLGPNRLRRAVLTRTYDTLPRLQHRVRPARASVRRKRRRLSPAPRQTRCSVQRSYRAAFGFDRRRSHVARHHPPSGTPASHRWPSQAPSRQPQQRRNVTHSAGVRLRGQLLFDVETPPNPEETPPALTSCSAVRHQDPLGQSITAAVSQACTAKVTRSVLAASRDSERSRHRPSAAAGPLGS